MLGKGFLNVLERLVLWLIKLSDYYKLSYYENALPSINKCLQCLHKTLIFP